ncbi:hypothetical protein [Peptoniphilus sp. HMSC062D09]|uniref:hypothetical protein n=1 Tax=Peptoniphilus sp. HMSC062D09 TaxID=1739305 RepID=UPI0008A516DF|nr:hypothetical protein [Peptoniphilus sp. HMSC062D09]OFK84304.1 hypothetical protein HMPREF2801_03040 [Peptoniphilus sp. HMSC062D09]
MFYLTEVEEIYDNRTKLYFEEVLTSYSSKSYRSALVSLYSVTICDIIYKLKELSEDYDDESAEKILSEMEEEMSRKSDLSFWESKLIDLAYDRHKILNNETKAYMDTLKKFRNLSAHPSLNENYELYQPNKEITIALIKNILSEILIKSPILNNKIVDKLTDDLSENKDWLLASNENLNSYLLKKYFEKMDPSTIKYIFKTFWKFCYVSDDEKCLENIEINIATLKSLLKYKYEELIPYLESEDVLKQVGDSYIQKLNVCKLLFLFPKLYLLLEENLKREIDTFIDTNNDAKIFSYFKYKNKIEHLENLRNINMNFPKDKEINTIYDTYADEGLQDKLLDLFIEKFGNSENFDEANELFDKLVYPFLENYNFEQFERIMEKINTNSQIYNRRRNYRDNTKLASKIIERFGYDIDFQQYSNFKYDESVNQVDDNNIPF